MQTNITNRTVNSAEIRSKPYEIRDTGLKGLLLRIQPSGVMTFYMEYKRGKRKKIGRADAITPVQARDLARNVLLEVYQGEDPADKRRLMKADNYLQFLEETYRPWLISNLKTGEETFDRLKKSFPELHRLKLHEINAFLIDKNWRSRRQKDGMKPASINRELADLRACLNRAVEWELLESNPLDRVKQIKLDTNRKVRYLKEDEEKRLRKTLDEREQRLADKRKSGNEWRAERGRRQYISLEDCAFADYLKPSVILSLNTGLRRGELFHLRWTDVDFENKILTVLAETSKTGKTRHVPLNEEAATLLRRWKDQLGVKSQFVFTGSDGKPFHDVRTSWSRLLKDAKIDNFRWHDMRHNHESRIITSKAF